MADRTLDHIGGRYLENIRRQRERVMQNGSEEALLEELETVEEVLYGTDSYFDHLDTTGFLSHQELKKLNQELADIIYEGGEALGTLYDLDQDVYDEAKKSFSAALVAASYAAQNHQRTAKTPVQTAFEVDEKLPDSYTEIMDELGIPEDGNLPI